MAKRRKSTRKAGSRTYVLRDGKLRLVRSNITNELPAPWPRWSQNLGCSPKAISRLRALYAKHGIQAEFDKKGRVKVADREMNRRMAEARQMVDYSAGLSGDARPKSEHYEMLKEREKKDQFWVDVDNKVAEYEREFGLTP